jgi:hypothetical protein
VSASGGGWAGRGPGRAGCWPTRRTRNEKVRAELCRRKITAVIPEKKDQVAARAAKGSRGGRPPAFDHDLYKRRNVVERAINKLK